MKKKCEIKIEKFFEEAIGKVKELYEKRLHKSRSDFICVVIMGIVMSRSVRYEEIALHMAGNSKVESKHRQIQRFMGSYDLDYDWILCFLLLLLPKNGKLKLTYDRTNWTFGKTKHNILTMSVYSHGIGIPIWFECLENSGGNSDADDRSYILLKCLDYIDKSRIKAVLGDSEFIGQEWIDFLLLKKIPFFIDIRSNQYLEYKGKRQKVQHWLRGKRKCAMDDVGIWGTRLSVAIKRVYKPRPTTKNKKKRKRVLAIVTNTEAKLALNEYKNRWSIEVMFKKLKTDGFNLEQTHLKDPIRLRKLFALCAIAFTICLLIGITKHFKIKPIKLKKHGFKAVSFFRYGLNAIRRAIVDYSRYPIEQLLSSLIQQIAKAKKLNEKIVM